MKHISMQFELFFIALVKTCSTKTFGFSVLYNLNPGYNWSARAVLSLKKRFKHGIAQQERVKPFLGLEACIFVVATKLKTPWSESASELYRPSDRRLSAK
jgi:hypothetical protein